jgi:hypothetical protein
LSQDPGRSVNLDEVIAKIPRFSAGLWISAVQWLDCNEIPRYA